MKLIGQHTFTDPESHVMKAGSEARFEQCCNAQAAVGSVKFSMKTQ